MLHTAVIVNNHGQHLDTQNTRTHKNTAIKLSLSAVIGRGILQRSEMTITLQDGAILHGKCTALMVKDKWMHCRGRKEKLCAKPQRIALFFSSCSLPSKILILQETIRHKIHLRYYWQAVVYGKVQSWKLQKCVCCKPSLHVDSKHCFRHVIRITLPLAIWAK